MLCCLLLLLEWWVRGRFLIPQKVRLSRVSYAFVIDSEVELVKPAFTTMTDCRSFFLLVIPLQKMCKNPHVASFFLVVQCRNAGAFVVNIIPIIQNM